jgi:hypothetical protein
MGRKTAHFSLWLDPKLKATPNCLPDIVSKTQIIGEQ